MLKSTCFYLSVLLYTNLAVGQEDICADHLREAEKHYEMGRFEKVAPTLLEDACYPDKFNDDQKRAALALLARATLAMDNLEGARNYLETLMAQFPDFTSRAQDKPVFREWVREIKQAFANRANLYALRNKAKVISVSMVEENAAQAPATIHVVDKETIAARGYRNLSELLEDIPEIAHRHPARYRPELSAARRGACRSHSGAGLRALRRRCFRRDCQYPHSPRAGRHG